MRKRNRIDWEKELRKTEQIRTRGFHMSVLSLLLAVAFLFGASKMNGGISVYPYLIMGGCFLAAVVVLVLTLRRRAEKQRKQKEMEEDE